MSSLVKKNEADEPNKADEIYTLTAKQEAVIAALLEGKTQREAAELAGLAEETISRWKRTAPLFLATLNQRHAELRAAHLDAVRALKGKAVKTLSTLLDSRNETTRLKAAALALQIDVDAPRPPAPVTVEQGQLLALFTAALGAPGQD